MNKIGDIITFPLRMKILDMRAMDDYIYYLAVPEEDEKRFLALHTGYSIINIEPDNDNLLPKIPKGVISWAYGQMDGEDDNNGKD